MSARSKKWECLFCGYVYDEDAGCPESGVPPGTPWDNLPDDWCCPNCSTEKDDFQPVDTN